MPFSSGTSSWVAVDLADPVAVNRAPGSVLFLRICLRLWAMLLIKHRHQCPSRFNPQFHHTQPAQPVPRERLHIPAACDGVVTDHWCSVLLWRGAAHPVGPRTSRGVQRGFQGGSPDADLHPPDFRRLRGRALLQGPHFLDVTRAAALLNAVTVVLGPNCPTVLKHSAARPHAARSHALTHSTHIHIHPFCGPANSKSRQPGNEGMRG